jgi:hypothetical protein
MKKRKHGALGMVFKNSNPRWIGKPRKERRKK